MRTFRIPSSHQHPRPRKPLGPGGSARGPDGCPQSTRRGSPRTGCVACPHPPWQRAAALLGPGPGDWPVQWSSLDLLLCLLDPQQPATLDHPHLGCGPSSDLSGPNPTPDLDRKMPPSLSDAEHQRGSTGNRPLREEEVGAEGLSSEARTRRGQWSATLSPSIPHTQALCL